MNQPKGELSMENITTNYAIVNQVKKATCMYTDKLLDMLSILNKESSSITSHNPIERNIYVIDHLFWLMGSNINEITDYKAFVCDHLNKIKVLEEKLIWFLMNYTDTDVSIPFSNTDITKRSVTISFLTMEEANKILNLPIFSSGKFINGYAILTGILLRNMIYVYLFGTSSLEEKVIERMKGACYMYASKGMPTDDIEKLIPFNYKIAAEFGIKGWNNTNDEDDNTSIDIHQITVNKEGNIEGSNKDIKALLELLETSMPAISFSSYKTLSIQFSYLCRHVNEFNISQEDDVKLDDLLSELKSKLHVHGLYNQPSIARWIKDKPNINLCGRNFIKRLPKLNKLLISIAKRNHCTDNDLIETYPDLIKKLYWNKGCSAAVTTICVTDCMNTICKIYKLLCKHIS